MSSSFIPQEDASTSKPPPTIVPTAMSIIISKLYNIISSSSVILQEIASTSKPPYTIVQSVQFIQTW